MNMPETPEKEKLSLWPEVLFATIHCVYNAKKDIGNLSIMAIGVAIFANLFSSGALEDVVRVVGVAEPTVMLPQAMT